MKTPINISGSGSTYVLGYCDSNYKEKMSKDECIQFVINGKNQVWIKIYKY